MWEMKISTEGEQNNNNKIRKGIIAYCLLSVEWKNTEQFFLFRIFFSWDVKYFVLAF